MNSKQKAEALGCRELVSIGWDGANNPMYRYYDELKLPSYMHSYPSKEEISVWEEFTRKLYGWEKK